MIRKQVVRIPGMYDTDKASDECALFCQDKSLTQQSFAEEADINTIIRRFGLDGPLPQGVRMPSYGDFTGLKTYEDAWEVLNAAQESFYAMPARVRARFENDPAQFVAFCSDPANAQEMKELGLVEPSQAPVPAPVVPSQMTVNPPAAPAAAAPVVAAPAAASTPSS